MSQIKNLFSLLHTEFRKNTYFKQVLLSYVLISCATFLVFSMIILNIMQNDYEKNLLEMNEHNIEQAYSFNTSVLSDISSYFQNSLDSVIVRKLLYSDDYDVTTALSANEAYNEFQKISSMIVSIDFINYSTETVYTKQGRRSFAQFSDQELFTLLQNLPPRKSPYFCYPREFPYFNGNDTSTRKVISLIYYFYNSGALVVNLDYDTYCSLLNFNQDNQYFHVMMINQNDMVMASTEDNQFMKLFKDDPLYQEILKQTKAKGTLNYEDETGKYNVAYHKSSQMGITYISMFPIENQLYGGSTLFTVTLRYSIIYLIVTLLLSFLSSYIIYNPVKKLKTVIHPADSDITYVKHNHKNDFEFLESVYKQLIEKNTALSRLKQNYTEEQQQKLLWMLMNDTGAPSIPRQDFESLDSCFEYLNYLVFIINIESGISPQDIEKDLPLCKFIIRNVTNELFEEQTNLLYVETAASRLIFMGNFEQYDKQKLYETALQIQQFFHDKGLFQISFGFGSPVMELENLSNSYNTAKTALINGRLNTLGCIQFYEDLQLVAPNKQRYPYETDQNILAALKSQNMEACQSGLEEFFSIIKNYHYDQIQRAVLQLGAALQRFEYVNEISNNLADTEQDNKSNLTLDELKAYFHERCKADIQAFTEIKTHSFAKTELISDINTFIEENIYNPNLSVAMIAEKVNLSINYLRNIYKENTGESLTTYIAGRKLTLVCDLLSNTDIPIQDISDKLGFTTKNYFFTFFKKHMNMTPTQYRSLHQKK